MQRFFFASSSSVYGDAERYPTSEEVTPQPVSPYGISKLACEHLCRVYYHSYGVPVVALRYFTVYGPRQRPDMAFNRFISAMLREEAITIYGDGEQTRNFTYVSDVVEANLLCTVHPVVGEIMNIGGGAQVSVNQTIAMLERILGKVARVNHQSQQTGDARHTGADIAKARLLLGYAPQVDLADGLREEVAWLVEETPHSNMGLYDTEIVKGSNVWRKAER